MRSRSGALRRSGRERIPDAREAEVLKVLHFGGGELGHAVVAERKREARIVDLATGKLWTGGVGPNCGHDTARLVHEFPARVFTQGLNKRDGCMGGQWLRKHGGVAQ